MSDTPKTTHVSACTRDCPDCCSLLVDKHADGSFSLRGNPEHPFTKGFICKKTKQYPELMRHPERITEPLIREGSGYWPVSWDDALRFIAKRIDKLRDKPERMLHVHGQGRRGVFAEVSNWFFGKLGSSTLSGSPCDEAGIEACIQDFGTLDHNWPEDILNSRRIVNWGRDFSRHSVHQAALVKQARKNGVQVLSITPSNDGFDGYSDRVVQIRPGTDRFLAAAVCKALLERRLPDAVRDAIGNFDAVETLLHAQDMDSLLTDCGVSRGDFDEIVAWYAAERPTATIVGWGMQRYTHGGANVRWVNAAAMFSGNIGIKGGGSYYNISSGRNFAKWAANADEGRPRRTMPIHDLPRTILKADPPVEFMWIDQVNALNQFPGGDTAVEAFGRCPMVVVVDAFFNDTALRADLILPCALMTEREEALGSCMHDYVAWSAKVQDPPGTARDDWDILADLGCRLAEPLELPDKENVLAEALSSPALHSTPEALREQGFLRGDWPEIAFEGMRFAYPDGKCRLMDTLPREAEADPAYPLHLLTLISGTKLHSQVLPDQQPSPPEARISPDSPGLAGIDLQQPVYAVSSRGRIEIRLSLDPGLHPEALVVRRGGWMRHGQCLNPLVQPLETDLGGGTAYYSQRVRLEN